MSAGDDNPHTPREGPSSGGARARLGSGRRRAATPEAPRPTTRLARRPSRPILALSTNPAQPDWEPADPARLVHPAPVNSSRPLGGTQVRVDTTPAITAATENGSQVTVGAPTEMPTVLARAVNPTGAAPELTEQRGQLSREASSAVAPSAVPSVPDARSPASPVPFAALPAGGDVRAPSAAPAASRGAFPSGMPSISRQALEWLLADSPVARAPGASSVEPVGVGEESVSEGSAAVLEESAVIPAELLRSRERARARARVMREVAPKRGVVREGPASAGPDGGSASPATEGETGEATRPRCPVRRSTDPTMFLLIGILG